MREATGALRAPVASFPRLPNTDYWLPITTPYREQDLSRTIRIIKPFLPASLLLFLLAGCSSYPQRMARVQEDFVRGEYESALSNICESDCEGGKDQILALLERALLKQSMGDFEGSNRDFETAYGLMEDYENRPSVSLRDIGSEAGAALVNETTLPYKGTGYEKFLVHIYKALNYLLLGDYEGAGVEIRRLDRRREIELETNRKAREAAEEAAREEEIPGEDLSGIESQLLAAYGPARDRAATVSNLYLSAFGSYLSALHYDLEGSWSESLIDYRRVLEQVPASRYARIDAVSSGADDISDPAVDLDLSRTGDLFLVFQSGLSPVKDQVYIPIPVGDGMLAIAFPFYRLVPTRLSRAAVYIDGRDAGATEILSDIEAKQVRELIDQIPVLIVRQAIRAAVKATMLHASKEAAGGWGELAASLYNIFSEQADLRSWLLLPRNIQVLRAYPPEGTRQVRIDILDEAGGVLDSVDFELEFRNDQTVLVNLRAVGYTPLLPDGLTVTQQWRALPRVPLAGRPRNRIGAE